MTLTQAVIKGGVWATVFKVTVKCLSLLRIIILARLLGPEAFGLMAVVLMSLDFVYLFTQMGVNTALIQKGNDIEGYLGTAQLISIGRGVFLSMVLFLSAPYLADFFNSPGASIFIKVASIAPFLLGLANIRMVYLEKELTFNKKYQYETVGVLVDMLVSISLAVIFRNAWCLVLGLIAGDFARLIYSYIIVQADFRLECHPASCKELFHFGKWLFLNGILVFLMARGGDLFVAKFVDISSLGYYTMATRIATIIPSEITYAFSQVLFPAFAKIKDEKTRLKSAVLKVAKVNGIVGFPLALLTFFFAEEITSNIFGATWAPIIPIIKLLAFMGLLMPVSNLFDSLLISLAETRLVFYLKTANAIILFVLLSYFTPRYGITGAALSVLLTQIILVPIIVCIGVRKLACSIIEYLRSFKESVISSAVMFCGVVLVNNVSFFESCPKIRLTLQLIAVMSVYYTILAITLNYWNDELSTYFSVKNIYKSLYASRPENKMLNK